MLTQWKRVFLHKRHSFYSAVRAEFFELLWMHAMFEREFGAGMSCGYAHAFTLPCFKRHFGNSSSDQE